MNMATKALSVTVAAATLALPPIAMGAEAGDIVFRAGVTHVAPDASSDPVEINGSTLSLAGGTSEVDVTSDTQLGLTVEYFFNSAWGLELLASTPFTHTAEGKGELAGLDILEATHLPPTLSAIYHFENGSNFVPYVGAGVNYTIFFDEEVTSEADTALTGLGLNATDASLDNSFGYALQVGFDYHINDQWLVNASVRYIDISTTAEITFESGDKISVDVDIDPFVYSVFAGYKF